jgi:hypothetical protein
MRASTRLIAPTHLDKSNRYKILSSPQIHNSGYIAQQSCLKGVTAHNKWH